LKKSISTGSLALALLTLGFPGVSSGTTDEAVAASIQATYAPIPEFSGMQWIDGKRFLVAHDAKYTVSPEKSPRASLVWLPESPAGIGVRSLTLDWPEPDAPSSDLESVARLPGTNQFLLVESGSTALNGRQFKRAFLIEMKGDDPVMLGFMELPEVVNVEGTAVARVAGGYVFLWAERADHQPSTTIWQAPLNLEPLSLGEATGSEYRPQDFTGKRWRPVSALEIDSRGVVYVASAYDTDDDSGPFNSVIWRIGSIDPDSGSAEVLVLDAEPSLIARVDGVKIESLSVVEEEGTYALFYGFDDEFFGGGLRKVLLQD
jgi:hypothetical protein